MTSGSTTIVGPSNELAPSNSRDGIPLCSNTQDGPSWQPTWSYQPLLVCVTEVQTLVPYKDGIGAPPGFRLRPFVFITEAGRPQGLPEGSSGEQEAWDRFPAIWRQPDGRVRTSPWRNNLASGGRLTFEHAFPIMVLEADPGGLADGSLDGTHGKHKKHKHKNKHKNRYKMMMMMNRNRNKFGRIKPRMGTAHTDSAGQIEGPGKDLEIGSDTGHDSDSVALVTPVDNGRS